MADDYQRRTYGDTPVGFGAKPGIVVVDFMVAFTDPQYPLGGAPLVLRAFENTIKMLEVARRYNVPIASCNTAYMNEREMPYWKISAVRDTFLHDHPSAPIDPRVHDPVLRPRRLQEGAVDLFQHGRCRILQQGARRHGHRHRLQHEGCIRATAVDSFSYRYRTIVPEDCVGDIEEQPHHDNLRDIGRRYVDISDLASVLAYFEEWRKSNA